MSIDEKTRTEREAAVFRRLVEHLRARTDVQNIDLMNLAGFCRNCLSNWMKDAADAKGVPMTKDQSREIVYGEPFEQWKAKHQKEASKDQKAAFEKSWAGHKHGMATVMPGRERSERARNPDIKGCMYVWIPGPRLRRAPE